MAYTYTEFDGVLLPDGNITQDHSTAAVESSIIDSIGGAVNYYGNNRKPARKLAPQCTGVYVGETTYIVDESGNRLVDESGNYIIAGDAETILRDQVEALRSKLGIWGALWRERNGDGALEWLTARLMRVTHTKQEQDKRLLAEVTAVWETNMVAWRAEDATTTSANMSAGSNGLTVSNGGSAPVDDATITIACTSGTITSVRVQAPAVGVDWTWTGSLATGESLVVDAGAKTVKKAGSDAYSGFTRNSGHTARGWLPLAVGQNPLVITLAGGNATVTVSHYNQWS